MNFFKFTKPKIVLAIVLFLCSVGLVIVDFGCGFDGSGDGNPFICEPGIILSGFILLGPGSGIILGLGNWIAEISLVLYFTTFIILTALWNYFLSALVIWIYRKIKNKKTEVR